MARQKGGDFDGTVRLKDGVLTVRARTPEASIDVEIREVDAASLGRLQGVVQNLAAQIGALQPEPLVKKSRVKRLTAKNHLRSV